MRVSLSGLKELKLIHILIMTLLVQSCRQHEPDIIIHQTKEFVLIDTAYPKNSIVPSDAYPRYPICYVGLITDTIRIGNGDHGTPCHNRVPYLHYMPSKYTDETLELFVDTSIHTTWS